MGRAIAAAAALSLAACAVDVEGAPCTTPGGSTECPAGQACGNDMKCSDRAAACAQTRCTPGESQCLDGDAKAESCDGVDGVCGVRVVDDCQGRGLRCGTKSGASACECPANGSSEFAAGDGGTVDAGAPPYPTGVGSPEECRFGILGDALSAAAAHATANGAATVRAYAPAGAPIVFAAPGETFPLPVAAGVTLVGSSSPGGATVIRADAAAQSTVLSVQGAVEGIQVENVSMTGTGVEVSCGASGVPRLTDVAVAGGGALARGVAVQGGCGATLEGVDVSDVAGPALRVDATEGAPVQAKGCRFRSSAVGVDARGGAVTLSANLAILSEVTSNVDQGVLLTGTTRIDATLDHVLVAGNGGTGVVLRSVPLTSTLSVTDCEIHSNGSVSPATYGGAFSRTAGGVLVSQLSLGAHSILGNRLYANSGDQLAFESSGTWSISPGSPCGPASNAFGDCPGQGAAVSKVGAGAVNATYTVWPGTPPDGFVFGAIDFSLYCNGFPSAPPVPSCPP